MSLNRSEVGLGIFFPALFIEISNLRNLLYSELFRGCTSESHGLEWDWTSRMIIAIMPCAWNFSFPLYQSSKHQKKRDGTDKRKKAGWSRKTKWETERMKNKEDTDKKKKRVEEEGKLYLDNLIISHLQSTSMDAPSLHQAAHCEDRASGAGQPVDFPLSFSQRGPACPYISTSGHADSDGHPSAATQHHTTMIPGIKYTNTQCTDHIYMKDPKKWHVTSGTLVVPISMLVENSTLKVLRIVLKQ